jgi:hypothetical protein
MIFKPHASKENYVFALAIQVVKVFPQLSLNANSK